MVVVVLFGIFLILQLIHIDLTNPEYDIKEDFIAVEQPPLQVTDILKTACYDCHSHQTNYPWYADVAPFSWFIVSDIRHGREELNFSEWVSYTDKKKKHKLKEIIKEVEEGEMPITIYTWMHEDANLTSEQIFALTDWVKSIQ